MPTSRETIPAAWLTRVQVIVGAHDTRPLIRSKNGFWLTIPLPAAGKSLRGGRITPGEWERRRGLRLRFVYTRTEKLPILSMSGLAKVEQAPSRGLMES